MIFKLSTTLQNSVINLQRLINEGQSCLIIMPTSVYNEIRNHVTNATYIFGGDSRISEKLEKDVGNIIIAPDIAAQGLNYGRWQRVVLFGCNYLMPISGKNVRPVNPSDHCLYKAMYGRIASPFDAYAIYWDNVDHTNTIIDSFTRENNIEPVTLEDTVN